ncbi:MAG: class I SAM-dependent methyltransferase [Chthoniobacterales bacterium]|nr:class I SAM-dependent methyltransferase [Chthoniobacterales bacterium]
MTDSTERFSDRVEDYVSYRPHYPSAVLDYLQVECQLEPSAVIADIGSGTGILSELFLENGNPVYAVEPNQPMRAAAERLLGHHVCFHSVHGAAEATTLPSASVDFVTAGQAFHWFDRAKARVEFARILHSLGWVVLIWNERLGSTTPFAKGYESLLRTYATDYLTVDHRRIDEHALSKFFGGDFGFSIFPNRQHFDFAGLQGRLLSSSYAPTSGHPRHEPMLAELRRLFATYQERGEVTIKYEAKVFCGHLG